VLRLPVRRDGADTEPPMNERLRVATVCQAGTEVGENFGILRLPPNRVLYSRTRAIRR